MACTDLNRERQTGEIMKADRGGGKRPETLIDRLKGQPVTGFIQVNKNKDVAPGRWYRSFGQRDNFRRFTRFDGGLFLFFLVF